MASQILDSLLGWLLYLDPAIAIILISLLVSVVITIAIKFLTNQTLMKDIREEQKELQKQMKTLKSNPKKMAQINERFMEINMKYMTHSMRPTLFTFIPIIIVFGWLSSHLGYYPITPGDTFKVTAVFEKDANGNVEISVPQGVQLEDNKNKEIINGESRWFLSGESGEYELIVLYKEKEYKKEVIITNEKEYAPVEKEFRKKGLFFSSAEENGLNKIVLGNEKILTFANVPLIKDIPWVNTWGWFGSYIFFSLVFSMSLRRAFNVY